MVVNDKYDVFFGKVVKDQGDHLIVSRYADEHIAVRRWTVIDKSTTKTCGPSDASANPTILSAQRNSTDAVEVLVQSQSCCVSKLPFESADVGPALELLGQETTFEEYGTGCAIFVRGWWSFESTEFSILFC